MPIPLLQTEEEAERRRSELCLVPATAVSVRAAPLHARAVAHFVDICIVQGFSLYGSKLASLVLVSLHARAAGGSAGPAAPLLKAAFAYSSAQMLAAAFASLSVLYFIALPLASGRTFGMALLGLRIRSDEGAGLTVRQLAFRLGGCALAYATGGLLCLVGLRQQDGRFFHDVLSGSRVAGE